jgi:large subunit ribosomal protein L4e
MSKISIPVYKIDGSKKGTISLGKAFLETVRLDLIQRAFVSEQSKKRQPYGTDKLAGKRTSAHYHGRRGIYFTMMNREMARMKRIHGQGFLNYTARFVPQAVKGRKAHPPKPEKNFEKKINKKEKKKALLSAIAASIKKDLLAARGHVLNGIETLPIIFEDKIETIQKTKEIVSTLEKLGLKKEIERVKEKKVRAGKGKTRGRKYKKKKGPLIIVKEDKGITKAVKNLPGFDVSTVNNLNIELLAPGGVPGRFCIWSESAIKELEKRI